MPGCSDFPPLLLVPASSTASVRAFIMLSPTMIQSRQFQFLLLFNRLHAARPRA